MARQPVPGGDSGQWGSILNTYLSVALNTDGTINSGVVGSTQLASGAVGATQANLSSLASGMLPSGILASRPAAAASNSGFYYLATDTAGGTIYQSNGTTWSQITTGVLHAARHATGGADPITPSSIGAEATSHKDQVNGYAGLDGAGRLKTSELPSALAMVTSQLGSSNASDDTATINTALSGGGYIKGKPGETYLISSPLKLVSGGNTTLDMSGCTIAYANTSVQCNMLQNAAVTPVVTATDVATTAASSVITSATLAASAVVGQQVGIVGAGPNGPVYNQPIWLYGTILSISANNITLTGNLNGVAASSTLSGATGYLFNRDTNVTLIGGTWNMGTNWTTLASRQAAGINSNCIRLRRIDRLVVSDMTFLQASLATNTGWCYGVNPADCTDFLIKNIYSEKMPGQGGNYGIDCAVQGTGPLTRGIIRDIQGTTQDDQVALGQADNDAASGNLAAASDTEGDITDVLVEGITGYYTRGALCCLFSGYGGNNAVRIMDRITIRSLKGQSQTFGVRLVEWIGQSWMDNILIEDVSVIPGFFNPITTPVIYVDATQMNTLTIRDIVWASEALPGNAGVIGVSKAPQTLVIDGVSMRGTGAGNIVSVTASAGTINSLTVSDVRQPDATASCNIITVYSGNTINRLLARDIEFAGSGVVVSNLSASVVGEVIAQNIRINNSGSSLYDSHATVSSNVVVLRFTDIYTACTLAWLAQPANIFLNGVEANSANTAIYASGVSATPINFWTTGVQLDQNQSLFGKDGSQIVANWTKPLSIVATPAAITTTETVVLSLPLTPNIVAVGSTFRVYAAGTISATTAGTLTGRLRLGTAGTTADTAAAATPATGSQTASVGWEIDGELVIRSVGSGGTALATIRASVAATAGHTTQTATVAINTTTQNYLSLTAIGGGTSPSITVTQATIEPKN